MLRIAGILLAASVALPSAAQDLSLCSWTHEATGATFDVSGLNVPQLRSVGYRVQDGRDNSFSGNCKCAELDTPEPACTASHGCADTYLFNVCGNLAMDFYQPADRRQCNATYNAGNTLNTELVRAAPGQGDVLQCTSTLLFLRRASPRRQCKSTPVTVLPATIIATSWAPPCPTRH